MEPRLGYFKNSSARYNSWVLVLHNDFDQFEVRRRLGNDKDLENLKKTFERRNSKFKDLKGAKSDEIKSIISNQEKLVGFFFPNGDYDPEKDKPSVVSIFILSHGDINGKIDTDHVIKTQKGDFIFDSYNKADIWKGLKNVPVLRDCLTLLFLAPCRGSSNEIRLSTESKQISAMVAKNSTWLSTKPNLSNFVTLYSTVETTGSHRNEEEGTWFVKAICDELNHMKKDADLPVFLTKVQKTICDKTGLNTDTCQTPQVHIFPHNRFTFTSCPVSESTDGKAKVENIVSEERKDFYSWKSDSGLSLRRGQALIFSDKKTFMLADKFAEHFQWLDYDVRKYDTREMKTIVANVTSVVNSTLCEDGSIVVCILTELIECDEGLAIKGEGGTVILGSLIHDFIGTNCKDLTGKPKLFFFLDTGIRADSPCIAKDLSDWKITANNHSGIFTFVAVGQPEMSSSPDVIQQLLDGLKSPKLKSGSSLQQMAAGILYRSNCSTSSANKIKPQISSTLQYLLDFPPCRNTYIAPHFKYDDSSSFSEKVVDFDGLFEQFVDAAKDDECKRKYDAWLLVAIPGMGKSAATHQLSKKLTAELPSHLVVTAFLEQNALFFNSNKGSIYPYQFLEHLLGESSREKLLVKLPSKEVIVLLDGFNEICPTHRNTVIVLIQGLLKLGVLMWITTRPHEELSVKQHVTKLVALEIQPLLKEEQTSLLKTFLYRRSDECSRILSKFDHSFNGTPLQIKMIAELYSQNRNVEGSMAALYFEFVKMKVELAMWRFHGTNKTKASFQPDLTKRLALLIKVAVNHLLKGKADDATEHAKLNDRNKETLDFSKFELYSEDGDEINQLGLATVSFEEEEFKSISFVHQTYSEFLVSLLFMTRMGYFDNYLPRPNKLDLTQILLKNEFIQVRSFIDSFFADQDLQVGELKKICTLDQLKENKAALIAYTCKEGLARLFKYLFENTNSNSFGTIAELVNLPYEYTFRSQKYSYFPLYAACFTSEELALHLIDLGADILNLDPEKCLLEQGATILHLAAKNGLSQITQKVVEKLPKMRNQKTNLKKTPLQVATENGHLECVKILIALCESTEERTAEREMALEIASKKGHYEIMEFLIRNGDDKFVKTRQWSETPLHWVSSAGHAELIPKLIDLGYDVNCKDTFFGNTPLHCAVSNGKINAFTKLLEMGALFTEKNLEGWTILHSALSNNNNTPCIEFILKNYRIVSLSIINNKSNKNETPLHFAVMCGNLADIKLLVEHQASLDIKNLAGWTVLHFAAFYNHPECLSYLLNQGFGTATHIASFQLALHCGHLEVVKILLNRNLVSPNGQLTNDPYDLPLIFLAKKSRDLWEKQKGKIQLTYNKPPEEIDTSGPFYHRPQELTLFQPQGNIINNQFIDCMRFMLSKEANPNQQNGNNETALHIAAENDDLGIVDLLIESAADLNCLSTKCETPLILAAKNGHVSSVERLARAEAVLDNVDNQRWSALHWAVHNGHTAVAKALVKAGCNVNLESPRSPLQLAASSGHLDSVQLLLDAQAAVNKQDESGMSAIHLAVRNGHNDVVDALIKKDCDLGLKAGISPQTALHIAAGNGNLVCVKKLISAGAKIDEQDVEGMSAVHWAAQNGHLGVLDFFINIGCITKFDGTSSALQLSANKGNLNCVLRLLDAEENQEMAIHQVLYWAAQGGRLRVVQAMINSGACPNSADFYPEGDTPLTAALAGKHEDCAQFLLEVMEIQ